MVGICIVGAGVGGGIHVRALQEVGEARLVAVVETDADRGRQFAEKWGADHYYSDLEQALDDRHVDVVHLCTPPFMHREQAARCAQAGKHVLIEKPLARTVAEADAIIAACETGGVKLGAIFQHRFTPLPRKVKAALEGGRLGKLYLGDTYVKWYRSDEYYRGGGWRATRDMEGGGTLINQTIHSIDLLQWLMGPVADVTGRTATVGHQIETEDVGLALLGFQSGALGVIEGSTATYPGFPERIEIHGENGSVILNEGKNQLEWHLRGEEPRIEGAAAEDGYARDPSAVSTEGHAAQFRDFYAAVREDRRPAVDGVEGRKALEIIEAVYRSSELGRQVTLPIG